MIRWQPLPVTLHQGRDQDKWRSSRQKGKEEQRKVRILRICSRLKFVQETKQTRRLNHVNPPKTESTAQRHTLLLFQIQNHHQKQLIWEVATAAAIQTTIWNQQRAPKPKEVPAPETSTQKEASYKVPRQYQVQEAKSNRPQQQKEWSMSTNKHSNTATKRLPEIETTENMVRRLLKELDKVIVELDQEGNTQTLMICRKKQMIWAPISLGME